MKEYITLRSGAKIPRIKKKDLDSGKYITRSELMQMHLSRTTPLWRCIAVGAAAIGATAALIGICRAKRQLLLRRRYARRYAEQLKLQKMKLQARSRSCDRTRADAKTL